MNSRTRPRFGLREVSPVDTNRTMKPDRIRILYCTSDFKAGGTQRYLLNLVCGLNRTRFDPAVVCLSAQGELRGAMEKTGVPIERCPIDHAMWHPLSLASIVSLARRIRGRFDIVHTLLGHANVVGLLASVLAGHRRVLASQRILDPVSGSFVSASSAMVALGRWLFRHVARHVVVNNPAIAAALRSEGLPADRIIFIANGIDTERFYPAADHDALRRAMGIDPLAPVVGFVGRMIRDKGLERVLAAAEAILPSFPALRILAVGDGPERARFEESAARGSLRGQVDFLGFREDPERIYPLLDVLAFPSTYSEGTPNVVLEAMACGVPVIVHRTVQTENTIRDGENGLLVDGVKLEALANALETLLRQPDRARAIGRAAREHICAAHSLPGMLRATESLYEQEMAS